MAGFCVQCGTPLVAGAKFCEGCGAAAAGAGTPPRPVPQNPAPVYAAPAAPAPVVAAPPRTVAQGGSSTAVKVILIILAVFVFLSLLLAGSCFYVAYRVKKRVHEFSGNAAPYTGSRDPCSKLSAAEASAILGEPVTSAEPNSDLSCEYHLGGNDGRILNIQYTWQGGGLAMKLTSGAMKNAIAGMNTLQPLDGIGDEALLMPMGSGLLMRKGDVLVHIDMRVANVKVDAAESMARTIAGRL
ncbi:MAG: zinc ribbon domain-containing protein [Terriglobales bacterium]